MSEWFILQVRSGEEKKILDTIKTQAQKKGLWEKIEEVKIPAEEVIEMKKGKKIKSLRRFFPGYVLMKMTMTFTDHGHWRWQRRSYLFLGGRNHFKV